MTKHMCIYGVFEPLWLFTSLLSVPQNLLNILMCLTESQNLGWRRRPRSPSPHTKIIKTHAVFKIVKIHAHYHVCIDLCSV